MEFKIKDNEEPFIIFSLSINDGNILLQAKNRDPDGPTRTIVCIKKDSGKLVLPGGVQEIEGLKVVDYGSNRIFVEGIDV